VSARFYTRRISRATYIVPTSPCRHVENVDPAMTPARGTVGTGNGTEERGVTGGEPALAEATTRATLAIPGSSRQDRGYGRWSNQRNGDDWTAYDRPMLVCLLGSDRLVREYVGEATC
jgi:hypothetical protein